jgi:hypothetical protein
MATTRSVRKLNREQAAYLAGLLDGEGTIALTRRHRAGNRQLVVSISNTDHLLLKHVLQTVGAGRITRKRTTSHRHTPSATYQIDNRQALALLAQIVPYLHTYKSKRATLVLNDYVRLTPRNGKYTPELKHARELFINRFLSLNPRF